MSSSPTCPRIFQSLYIPQYFSVQLVFDLYRLRCFHLAEAAQVGIDLQYLGLGRGRICGW